MKNFLKSVNFSVPTDELSEIKKQTKEVVAALGKGIKKNKIKAEVFVGGSFAKGTLAKSDEYDIDIFIRFDRKYEDLSYYLEQVVKKSLKDYKHEKVHGSRNYFKLWKEKLVDPTWKERNALAALSRESFEKFQPVVLRFLKNPSKKDFEVEKISKEKLKKQAKTKKAEFLQIEIKTNRQEGDIAGTKLKKFANFLEREIGKYYLVLRSEFEYDLGKTGKSYLIVKNKKDIVRPGPPIKMKDATRAFKKANKNTFVKAGKLYTKIKMPGKAKEFVNSWKKDNKKVVKDMGIVTLSI
jgi:tRNA nucleotidyltransferase (CCA-adding enzyme)